MAERPLQNIATDDLVDELRKRSGVVPSIWDVDDVRTIVEEDEDCEDMEDEKIEEVCAAFLDRVGPRLEEALARRGYDYLGDAWQDAKSELLSAQSGPKP